MANPDNKALEAYIEIFESQARMLYPQLQDETGKVRSFESSCAQSDHYADTLTLLCVRLHICVSRFMLKQDDASLIGLVDLYGTAVRLIEKFSALDASSDFCILLDLPPTIDR